MFGCFAGWWTVVVVVVVVVDDDDDDAVYVINLGMEPSIPVAGIGENGARSIRHQSLRNAVRTVIIRNTALADTDEEASICSRNCVTLRQQLRAIECIFSETSAEQTYARKEQIRVASDF